MIKTSKLILIRHAPVKTKVGCFPDNDPDAIIDELKIKKLAGHIPEDCLWYVSPLKRTIQTANALSKYVNVKEMKKERVKTAERRLMSALRRVANAEIPLDLMSEYVKNLDVARKLSNRSLADKSPKKYQKMDQIESLKYEDKRVLLEENIKDITVHKERVEVSF